MLFASHKTRPELMAFDPRLVIFDKKIAIATMADRSPTEATLAHMGVAGLIDGVLSGVTREGALAQADVLLQSVAELI